MRRAHDKSSGWQEDQAGQQAGATGTGPGTTSGAAASSGGGEGQYRSTTTSTTRTYEGGQPTAGYGRTPQHGEPGGYGPMAVEHGTSTVHGGLFLVLAGLLTFLAGLAFVQRAAFYHAHNLYFYNWGIVSWGWVLFGLGIATFAVGASHLLGLPMSRPAGIVMAVATAVAGFMIIAFYPLWGIIITALGLAALWGLAHGAQSKSLQREYERQEYEHRHGQMTM